MLIVCKEVGAICNFGASLENSWINSILPTPGLRRALITLDSSTTLTLVALRTSSSFKSIGTLLMWSLGDFRTHSLKARACLSWKK